MGCWNIHGGVSKVSIGVGQKIVMIILDKPEKYMSEGTSMYHCPRFLPIVGEYNEYGGIENIQRDENVEYIENMYRISIVRFIEAVIQGANVDCKEECQGAEIRGFNYMYEHYGFYKEVIEYAKNNDQNAFKKSNVSSAVLEQMGFEFKKDLSTGDMRYKLYYQHPEAKNIIAMSDGTWTLFKIEGEKNISCLYSPQAVCSLFKKYGVILSGQEEMKGKTVFHDRIKSAVAELKDIEHKFGFKAEEYGDIDEESKLKLIDLAEQSVKLFSKSVIGKHVHKLREWPHLEYSAFQEPLNNDLAELLAFDSVMFSTHNLYRPHENMIGEQCGNKKACEALFKAALNANKCD